MKNVDDKHDVKIDRNLTNIVLIINYLVMDLWARNCYDFIIFGRYVPYQCWMYIL